MLNISKIEKMGASLRATLNGDVNIDADQILYATGRVPNTGSLGLENTSVQMKPDGSVVVDDYSKTDVDSIYAIGDCTKRMQNDTRCYRRRARRGRDSLQ